MADARYRHPGYEPTDPPPPRETPSFMARTANTPIARLLVMIAATATAVTGVVTATGAAVVSVINATGEANARKTNAEIDRRIDAIEVRVNGRFGLDLEEKARQKKDEEIDDELGRIRARIRKLEAAP